jgi:hypothetical protein
MSNKIFERIPGTLSTLVNDEYVTYDVQLDLEVAQLRGQGGLENAAISKVSLAPGSVVPDGRPYTLRYTYRGKKYENVGLRVHLGVLLAG